MSKSTHKIRKTLDREKTHKDWLEKNLKGSKQLRESKKNLLKLYTELALQEQEETELQTSQPKR